MKLLIISLMIVGISYTNSYAVCEGWKKEIDQKRIQLALLNPRDENIARINKLREILYLLRQYIICVGENDGF